MEQSLKKLNLIVSDTGSTCCLVSKGVHDLLHYYRTATNLNLRLITISAVFSENKDMDANGITHDFLSAISHEDVAFLQYTSGSTSNPKGVCISHSNLLHQILSYLADGKGFRSGETFVASRARYFY